MTMEVRRLTQDDAEAFRKIRLEALVRSSTVCASTRCSAA
jgi:hypothetical protein